MLQLKRSGPGALAAFLVLVAANSASAQTVASSFAELRRVLKTGQTVVVTASNGQRTKGKVAELLEAPPSLVVLGPAPQTFMEDGVAEIRATDSWRNGAFIGGSIGAGLALWDYLIDPSEPGNAVIFGVAIGVGTAIGVGIDSLIGRDRLLYRSQQQTLTLRISPLAVGDRRGVSVAISF
jgi:hypothetical protein